MKRKILATLITTMAVGATCAFAANPFVDVPSDSWAYQSVVELANAGIIQGVDGQYFEGNRNITRYEAAEMVAKAMAHQDKATTEQRALINKLADEYAEELNNLGVRVSALENKVGNVKLTGDARLRYRYQDGAVDDDNSWDYRVRIRANATVNDRTTVTYGISTNNQNFGSNDAASDSDEDIYTDNAKVDYNFGSPNWNLSVGRTSDYIIGGPRAYGYQYGDVFDRAELQFNNGNIAVTAGYGKFKEGTSDGDGEYANNLLGTKTAYGEIEGFFGNGSAVGVYYNNFDGENEHNTKNGGFKADDLWGAYVSANVGSKWNILANYESLSSDAKHIKGYESKSDPEVWIGKVTYGKASMDVPQSWDVWVEYLDAEDGAFLGGSTNSWRFNNLDNIQSWGVGADYTFMKNGMFQVMTSFASETKDGPESDPEEQTRAQFVFKF